MKNTRTSGITLISLVITIIVLIILASVATYSGIEVVKSSNVTAFTTELKILQTNVDKIRSQKQSFDETEGESIQTGSAHYNELIERLKIVKDYGYSDDTASIAGYKFFTEEQLVNNLHIEGVKQSVFINLEKSEAEVNMMSPLTWAYVGDCVYELFIRTELINKTNLKPHKLHIESIKYVKAQAQAEFLKSIMEDLTEEEKDIIRRGRNAENHHLPKNCDVKDYMYATAFEALIGYLYLNGREDRLKEIFDKIFD